jgi:hypothetical protein
MPFSDPLPKFPDSRPCLSSPRKRGPREARTGKQGQNPRETRSTRTSRIWVPAFAGMTKSATVFWPQCEKLIKNLPTNSFKEPFYSVFPGGPLVWSPPAGLQACAAPDRRPLRGLKTPINSIFLNPSRVRKKNQDASTPGWILIACQLRKDDSGAWDGPRRSRRGGEACSPPGMNILRLTS